MSLLGTVVAAPVLSALAEAVLLVAASDEQFDPTKVTPGPAGFVMTAVFGAAVIVLGFLLVTRLRRNAYRHEVRESIEAELAELQTGGGSVPGESVQDGSERGGSQPPVETEGDDADGR